jgi:hypothetical protein
MKYKPTILNISAGLFLIWIISYTILNNDLLSDNGGWGIISMIGLAGIVIVGFLIDLVLQRIIKDMKTLNLVELILTIVIALFIISDL